MMFTFIANIIVFIILFYSNWPVHIQQDQIPYFLTLTIIGISLLSWGLASNGKTIKTVLSDGGTIEDRPSFGRIIFGVIFLILSIIPLFIPIPNN